MRRFAVVLVLLLAVPLTAHADEASRRAKAQEMVKLLHVERMMTQMMDTIRQSFQQNFDQALGPGMKPEDKAKFEAFEKQMFDKMNEALSWKSLEPEYVQIYADTYTDEQLDAIVAFYSSPAGQAILEKTPSLMTKGAEIAQKKLAAVMPELQKMEEDFVKANTPARNTTTDHILRIPKK